MPPVVMQIELPAGLEEFHLPEGVHRRLQDLLDRQDQGQSLTPAERKEAEGLVELTEWLSLVRLHNRKRAETGTRRRNVNPKSPDMIE